MSTTKQTTLQANNDMQVHANYPKIIQYAVYSAEEEDALLVQLHWRCHTSMPIIKINSYSYEDSQDQQETYCRIYKAEIQEISSHIEQLSYLSLPEILCLLTEYLLGMQVLCYRYNTEILCSQIYFGINAKGEPKVYQYPNQEHFNAEFSNQFQIQKQNAIERIVNGLFEIVYKRFDPKKNQDIRVFQEIAQRVCERMFTSFADVHMLVRDLAQAFGVKVPIKIGGKRKSNERKPHKSPKANLQQIHQSNLQPQQQHLEVHPHSHHQLNLQQQPLVSNLFTNKITNQSMATTNFSNMMKSKQQLNEGFRYLNKPQAHQIINNGKPIVDSIMVENKMDNYMGKKSSNNNISMQGIGRGVDNRYNFGGLIPVNAVIGNFVGNVQNHSNGHNLVGSSQMSMEGPQIHINLPYSFSPHQNTFPGSPFSLPKVNFITSNQMEGSYGPLGQKIMIPINNFMEGEDLKQSVWCGEDKKASCLYVKLEKLDGLGREIKGSFARMD